MTNNKAKNIALLVNAISANGNALKVATEIERILLESQINFEKFIDWPKEFIGFTEIWLVGGDGTVSYFINHYQDIKLPIAVFKGGTGNDISWKLYGDLSIKDQINYVLNSSAKFVDAGRCNDKLFINGVGIGFDGSVLKSMQMIRKFGSHLGYLLVVLKQIFSYRSPVFEVEYRGKKVKEKFLLLMAFNSSRTGGGIMVSPKAEINDGKLNILLCKELSVWKRLKYLPLIERGKHLELDEIEHFTDTKFFVQCKQPTYAQLDGELIQYESFDIEVLPNRFQFLY